MPHVNRIHIKKSRNIRDLDIDLVDAVDVDGQAGGTSASTFKHLILTGPNGSGKSGVLETIAEELRIALTWNPQMQLPLLEGAQNSLTFDCDSRFLPDIFARGELIVVYMQSRRNIRHGEVRGPKRTKRRKPEELIPATNTAGELHQFMVNKHAEMTYALIEGDQAKAKRIQGWFDSFLRHMRTITEDEQLKMIYESIEFTFKFERTDGYIFDLNSLADGYAAILALLAELFIRVEAAQVTRKDFTFIPDGIVIVDEIETHLHLSLQEQILPFLTEIFPRFQFIVATHSPAVIASIPNAVVYDLKSRNRTMSERFRGVRYGAMMTEHFGISSEIDLDSTEKLVRLRALATIEKRTDDEEAEYLRLCDELMRRSPNLAVEVWMIREGLGHQDRPLAERLS